VLDGYQEIQYNTNRMIESRKQAYPSIFNGSKKKHNPGDRGGFIERSRRYGALVPSWMLIEYMRRNRITQGEAQQRMGCSRSLLQCWLGKRPGRNMGVPKDAFIKLIIATVPDKRYQLEAGNGKIDILHSIAFL